MQQTQFVSQIKFLLNGRAVFVAKVLPVTQSSAKAVTTGFTRDARK